MNDDTRRQVEAALERVYRELNADAGPMTEDRRTRDFVFHMLDWSGDLAALAKLYREPAKHDAEEWREAVQAFLLHAVGHLLAAARLGGGVSDPFAATDTVAGKAARAGSAA